MAVGDITYYQFSSIIPERNFTPLHQGSVPRLLLPVYVHWWISKRGIRTADHSLCSYGDNLVVCGVVARRQKMPRLCIKE